MRPRVLVAILVAAAAAWLTFAGGPRVERAAAGSRPNVVTIMVDDQPLGTMGVMDNVNSLIADRGASFPSFYVNWPLCCPSRATFLTGQYAHNHGVLGNIPPLGGFAALDSSNTLAVWLKRAGYRTVHIGKYLNTYGARDPELVPPGWTQWDTAITGSTQDVYDYVLNHNGRLVDYGSSPEDFKQDVITDIAVRTIERHADGPRPMFLAVDYTAPHNATGAPSPQPPFDCERAAQPAPRHADAFDTAPLPRPPSFNEDDVSDKPSQIADQPLLDAATIAELTRQYRCRLEALLSVDDGVARIVGALADAGVLSNTYLLYTSDNGFFQGEHRIPDGKTKVYDPASRQPLLIRGPGIRHGITVRDLATNADVAPTITQITGARRGLDFDGRSLLGAMENPSRETARELLIETRAYKAVRTERYLYVEYRSGERELYDLALDPDQLQSQHDDPAYADVERALAKRLAALRGCAGAECRARPSLRLRISGRGSDDCLRQATAKIVGADAKRLVEVEFALGGEPVERDSSSPFRARLPLHQVDPGSSARVSALSSLLDGRRITLGGKVRRCA